MKALAASSIGQDEQSVRALGDYNRTVELGLNTCFHQLYATDTMPETKTTSKAGVLGTIVCEFGQGLAGQIQAESLAHRGEDDFDQAYVLANRPKTGSLYLFSMITGMTLFP